MYLFVFMNYMNFGIILMMVCVFMMNLGFYSVDFRFLFNICSSKSIVVDGFLELLVGGVVI